jgi:hypothetical protein
LPVQTTSYWSKESQDVDKSQKANEQGVTEQQEGKSTSKEGEPTQGDYGQEKSEGAKWLLSEWSVAPFPRERLAT